MLSRIFDCLKSMGNNITAEQAAFHAKALDITGKNVLITGANTGIGKETTRVLYMKGANVYIACRTKAKAEDAIADILKGIQNPGNNVLKFLPLDLGSLESVRNCASEFKDLSIPLHYLVNNAGIMACPKSQTTDGFEAQFGTNHIGHFLLTNLLLPELREGAPSRIINVSSTAHKSGEIDFSDIMYEKRKYAPFPAYCASKLANVLFTRELAKRLAGSNITAYSLHPGVIPTELGRNNAVADFLYKVTKPFIKTIPEGAATTVYCVCAPNLEKHSGEYFADCHLDETSKHGKNMKAAEQLWELSVQLVSLTPEEIALAWPDSHQVDGRLNVPVNNSNI